MKIWLLSIFAFPHKSHVIQTMQTIGRKANTLKHQQCHTFLKSFTI